MVRDPLTDTAPDCPRCESDRAAWLTQGHHILHCPDCGHETPDTEL